MAVGTQRRRDLCGQGKLGEELGGLDWVAGDRYVPLLLFPWQMWNKKGEMRRYHFLITFPRSQNTF